MPVFEKPPLETLPPVRERWTPLYLEHGRIEVDGASVKWIGSDRTVFRIPVASLSVLMLGPGTTVTHAAIKACAVCNTPVCWIGAEGMHFYAFGSNPTHDNANARKQAVLASDPKRRDEIARRMFRLRFTGTNIEGIPLNELRGMEGRRVKALYAEMGARYGVAWKGRAYDVNHWDVSDDINRAVSTANAALYSLTTAIVCALGYVPHLGFIHTAAERSFVLDIADIYKPVTTLPAAFETLALNPDATEDEIITRLKAHIEAEKLIRRIPADIEKLWEGA
jgi:CRISPR-associated protein Cas1